MGTPPIRGMGPGWILRSWSGRSSIPQRIARFRQSGVRTNAAANAATVTMNSEYMADTSEEKDRRMEPIQSDSTSERLCGVLCTSRADKGGLKSRVGRRTQGVPRLPHLYQK